MLIEKAAGLGYLVAFFSSHTMFFNNVVDVVDDVFTGKRCRKHIIIMRKNKSHFLGVVADGARAIMFGRKDVEQLQKCVLCLC